MQSIFKGAKEKLTEAGCDLPDSMLFNFQGRTIAITPEQDAMLNGHLDRILETPKEERPTAIITGNPRLAEAIWLKLLERGCRVPDDISIITFGAEGDVGAIRDQFAVVAFEAESVGRWAAEVLTEMIDRQRDIDDDEMIEIELTMKNGKTLGEPG